MKALKGRGAIGKGAMIFCVILLALAMVLPALADGPDGHGGKSDKSASGGPPEGRGNSGETDPGQPDQPGPGKDLPEQASSQDDPGQGRADQAGSRGKQGRDQAHPDQASSRDNPGKGRADQAGSRGNRGQDRAHPDQAGSRDNPGQGRADQAGSRGKQGQDQAHPDPAGSQDNQGQGRPLAKQSVAGTAFTQSGEGCNIYRYRGKPQPVTFPFSDTSQGNGVVSISNTGGLKNLRITVNGQRCQVSMDNQTGPIMVDVSTALLSSGSDSIVVTALGKPGTCATVLLR